MPSPSRCPIRSSAAPTAPASAPSAARTSTPSRTSTWRSALIPAGRSSASCGRNDERRRRRERDEAEPLEYGAARRQRVGVEPAVAALSRQLCALRDRRAIEPSPAALGQRDAAEQAGELDAVLEVDPPARDRCPVDDGYYRDRDFREARAVAATENTLRELDELVRRDTKLDIRRRRRDRGGLGDDHRLLVLRLEPGREQPLAQLRAVVGVVLPLDVPRDLAHPRDERLDLAVVRPPEHGAPALAHEEAVRRGLAPHLLVEAREDPGRIHRLRL